MPNNNKKRPVSHPTPRLFEAFLQTPQFQLQRPLLPLHPTHKIANTRIPTSRPSHLFFPIQRSTNCMCLCQPTTTSKANSTNKSSQKLLTQKKKKKTHFPSTEEIATLCLHWTGCSSSESASAAKWRPERTAPAVPSFPQPNLQMHPFQFYALFEAFLQRPSYQPSASPPKPETIPLKARASSGTCCRRSVFVVAAARAWRPLGVVLVAIWISLSLLLPLQLETVLFGEIFLRMSLLLTIPYPLLFFVTSCLFNFSTRQPLFLSISNVRTLFRQLIKKKKTSSVGPISYLMYCLKSQAHSSFLLTIFLTQSLARGIV
jgi:hypothetical protein